MNLPIFTIICGAICLVSSHDSQLLQAFVSSNLDFSAEVYTQLKQTYNNASFLFSPVSALVILGLAQTAARGVTAKQLSKGLHLPDDPKKVEATFQQLLPTLKGNEKYALSSTNKVYVKNGYKISEEFKNIAQKSFGAEVQNVNFENKEAAAKEMNDWFADQTHHTVQDLISSLKLMETTRLMLINTLYFKATWVNPFNERNTFRKKFYVDKENYVEVDMMNITQNFKCKSSEELKALFVEVPFHGDNISMVIVVPYEVDGLPLIENQINTVLNTKLEDRAEVNLQLPKFKRETKVELTQVLKNLGMTDAFEDYAEFSGFGETGDEQIKISDVIQKSVIEVDEKGTVATSANAVHGIVTYSAGGKPPPAKFVADHPFMYFIKSPAGIMFIGCYVK